MTVEEIADYLKLLGFNVERDGQSWIYNIYTPELTAQLSEHSYGIGLYLYGDDTDDILLDLLSKSYTVTSYKGSRYLYDITESNNRRNSRLS